jgi:hypothetical protein
MIGGLVPDRGWKRAFDEPISLPCGRKLVTLEEAGTYITKPPKACHVAPEWQAAMEALILVATKGGPTMLARIGAEEMDRLRRGGENGSRPCRRVCRGSQKQNAGIPLAGFSSGSCWV